MANTPLPPGTYTIQIGADGKPDWSTARPAARPVSVRERLATGAPYGGNPLDLAAAAIAQRNAAQHAFSARQYLANGQEPWRGPVERVVFLSKACERQHDAAEWSAKARLLMGLPE